MNIGSEEMVTINQLVDLVADIAGKRIIKKHIPAPKGCVAATPITGSSGGNFHWAPSLPLRTGLETPMLGSRRKSVAIT